MYSRIAAAVI